MARVVARALISTHRAAQFPANAAYLLRNTEPGWAQLDWFLEHSVPEVTEWLVLTQGARGDETRGKMNNAFDPATAAGPGRRDPGPGRTAPAAARPRVPAVLHPPGRGRPGSRRAALRRRRPRLPGRLQQRGLGRARPSRGSSRRSPRSSATLCTHTRYLQPGILDYAEDLLAHAQRPDRPGRAGHVHLHRLRGQRPGPADRPAPHRPPRHHRHRRGLPRQLGPDRGHLAVAGGAVPARPVGAAGARPGLLPAPGRRAWAPGWPVRSRRRSGTWSGMATGWPRSSPTRCSPPTASTRSRPTCSARWPRWCAGPAACSIADEVQSGFARSGERMWGYQRHGA